MSSASSSAPSSEWSTMIRRRRSTYIMGRSSIALVRETRGQIMQYLCYCFAILWFVFGTHDLTMCDVPLTGDERDRKMYEIFKGCRDRPVEHAMWSVVGVWALIGAFLRASVAAATDTSLLYHAMLFITLNDFMVLFMLAMSRDILPLYYVGLAACIFAYQPYMTYLAYEAYSVVAALIALASLPFALRDLFSCGTPLVSVENDGFAGNLADCKEVPVKKTLFGLVGSGRLFFIVVRLYSAFVASSLESFNYLMLLNLAASLGQLLCLVRAQVDPTTFMFWIFAAVGLDATVYFESCLKMEEVEDMEGDHAASPVDSRKTK